MTVMNAELYRALKEAGASDESASKAAESLAAYDRQFADVRADLRLLKWMSGTIIAGVIALIIKLFV